LQRVITLEIDIDAKRRLLGNVSWCLPDENRCARHCREDRIGEGRIGSSCALIGLKFGVLRFTNLDCATALFHIEGDRYTFDCDDLTDQLGDVGDRPARFAGIDLQQRFLLLISGFVVDVNRDTSVALQDVAREMRY